MDEQIEQKFQEFRDFIYEQRRLQNLTQNELCERIGIKRPTLFNWLSGRTKMSLENYWRVLIALEAKEEIKPKLTLTEN